MAAVKKRVPPRARIRTKPDKAASRRNSRQRIDRQKVKEALEKAFRVKFPHDTVDISDGYEDNVHVMVVSREFDALTERQKQDLMWTIVEASELSEPEKRLISLLYPVSPDEIK